MGCTATATAKPQKGKRLLNGFIWLVSVGMGIPSAFALLFVYGFIIDIKTQATKESRQQAKNEQPTQSKK